MSAIERTLTWRVFGYDFLGDLHVFISEVKWSAIGVVWCFIMLQWNKYAKREEEGEGE